MRRSIEETRQFSRELKKLRRKYPSVDREVEEFVASLSARDDLPGQKVPGAGYDVYKYRLRNRSARIGASGGFRIVYFVRQQLDIVLLTIYSKSTQDDIRASEIRDIVRSL